MTMMSDYGAFQYTSSLRARRIRLFFIQPSYLGDRSSLLKVDLVEESLDAVDLDALAYVWGKGSQKVGIRCKRQKYRYRGKFIRGTDRSS